MLSSMTPVALSDLLEFCRLPKPSPPSPKPNPASSSSLTLSFGTQQDQTDPPPHRSRARSPANTQLRLRPQLKRSPPYQQWLDTSVEYKISEHFS